MVLNSRALIKGEERSLWDRIGVFGSALCLLHCALTPLAIGFLSASGLGFLGDELVHQVLAVVLLAVALLAFVPAYKVHRRRSILLAGFTGMVFILFAGFAPHEILPGLAEVGLTMSGSAVLVGAHLFNQRLYRDQHDSAVNGSSRRHGVVS